MSKLENVSEASMEPIVTRPILFSGPMVRAILDGKKTQTRRIVKDMTYHEERPYWKCVWRTGKQSTSSMDLPNRMKSPYGEEGERLWVRETWQSMAAMNQCHPVDDQYVYRATDPDWESMDGWKWRPSIFMPREASRITLEITGVRIQRLQAINVYDASAEGACYAWATSKEFSSLGMEGNDDRAIAKFRAIWSHINGKESWKSNPFVWVVEFRRI